jgi:predicted porin
MNKKLIALGIAYALAAPLAAQAGVEVYGDARVSVDYSDNGDNNTAATANPSSCTPSGADTCEKTKMSVSSNASYLGFKGDEDLGNGLSAIWQLEQGVNFDTGTAFTEDRPTYAGLGGDFGTLMAGRFDTPYMSATDRYDIFIDTKADYNAIMGSMKGDRIFDQRVSNTLFYATPDLGGLKAAMAYVFSDVLGSVSNGNPSTSDTLPISKSAAKRDAFSLSSNYDNGPLSLAAAYQLMRKSSNSGNNITGWKVGGSYTIRDVTTLALIYESLDEGGTIKDRKAYYLSVAHQIGDTTVKLAFANAGKCGGASASCDKTGADQVSVGASYSLSKNTEVYALYTLVSNDNNASYGLVYGPSSVTKADGTMSDVSSISFGINHMFSSK